MAWEDCWKDVFMSDSQTKFTVDYKVEATQRVIDSGRTITGVARALNTEVGPIDNWVRSER